MLKTCKGNSFEARRDRAIILTLLDNGVRVSGLVGLRYTPDDSDTNDVLLQQSALRVTLKGGDMRLVPIGRAAAYAIDRYLRARRNHNKSHRKELWLSPKGALTDSGVRQMLKRRAKLAGIHHIYPHLFRHTAAHLLKLSGLSEEELMAICGWKSAAMAKRYGASAAAARARTAHRRVSRQTRPQQPDPRYTSAPGSLPGPGARLLGDLVEVQARKLAEVVEAEFTRQFAHELRRDRCGRVPPRLDLSPERSPILPRVGQTRGLAEHFTDLTAQVVVVITQQVPDGNALTRVDDRDELPAHLDHGRDERVGRCQLPRRPESKGK
ncbi:tyrosine-type recombinase/integrase [Nocardiopsis gilva]|uniref:tyrosine-type recombinase/integrase n=1 Tax=Nocardiopsis gilva TaxID=280236 RepID=UPI001E46FDEB|nr:tyrosine-type recombinase/integrase [Nocardiopsis gilva]